MDPQGRRRVVPHAPGRPAVPADKAGAVGKAAETMAARVEQAPLEVVAQERQVWAEKQAQAAKAEQVARAAKEVVATVAPEELVEALGGRAVLQMEEAAGRVVAEAQVAISLIAGLI